VSDFQLATLCTDVAQWAFMLWLLSLIRRGKQP